MILGFRDEIAIDLLLFEPSSAESRQGIPVTTGTGEPIQKHPLTPQERFAQVPLMSNEMMFVA
jgi:hypothetical protein